MTRNYSQTYKDFIMRFGKNKNFLFDFLLAIGCKINRSLKKTDSFHALKFRPKSKTALEAVHKLHT